MKTTKKGFTLIELIVVIAIIGVLAAILVPAMLGYVKKSKIQSANSAANTWLKNANTALEEMDEDELDLADGAYGRGSSSNNSSGTADFTTLKEYMADYSDDVNSGTWAIYVHNGVAIAAAAKSGRYYGCQPGAPTNKKYDTVMGSNPDLVGALDVAVQAWATAHGETINTVTAITT